MRVGTLMKEYEIKYGRSLRDLKRAPGYKKMWNALVSAVGYHDERSPHPARAFIANASAERNRLTPCAL
jgi:hypothetical protein